MSKKCCFCLSGIEPNKAFEVYAGEVSEYDDLREFTNDHGEKTYVCEVCQHQITSKVLPLLDSFTMSREG